MEPVDVLVSLFLAAKAMSRGGLQSLLQRRVQPSLPLRRAKGRLRLVTDDGDDAGESAPPTALPQDGAGTAAPAPEAIPSPAPASDLVVAPSLELGGFMPLIQALVEHGPRLIQQEQEVRLHLAESRLARVKAELEIENTKHRRKTEIDHTLKARQLELEGEKHRREAEIDHTLKARQLELEDEKHRREDEAAQKQELARYSLQKTSLLIGGFIFGVLILGIGAAAIFMGSATAMNLLEKLVAGVIGFLGGYGFGARAEKKKEKEKD